MEIPPILIIVMFLIIIYLIMTRPKSVTTSRHVSSQTTVRLRSQQGQDIPVKPKQGQFFIGRDPKSDLPINSELVSKRHAIIVQEANGWMLYDNDSTNGTFVNGQRIAQHLLRSGDQVRIGPAVYVFVDESATVRAAPPAGPATPQPSQKISPHSGITPVDPPSARISTHDISLQNYQKLKKLGEGGIGEVYQAKHITTGQLVAIKFFYQGDPYLRQKFDAEIRLSEILHHPNIIQTFGGGQDPVAGPYLIMEYIDGSTLLDLNRQANGRLPHPQIITIIGQICEALHYAHGLGIYHRDIKPSNIMITRQNRAKLIDFGIARLAAAKTITPKGVVIGTTTYLSYEQAVGHRVEGRSDIYSLGVVLYELLTGRPPFYNPDSLAVIQCHVKETPPPLRQINPNVPEALEKITMRCLEKKIEHRYDAPGLAQALGYTFQTSGSNTQNSTISRPGQATTGATVVTSTGQAVSISGATMLGRQNLNPNDGLMSGQHAVIENKNGYYWLRDQSRNGTWVNGVRVNEQVLRSGDVIKMGNTTLRFEVR